MRAIPFVVYEDLKTLSDNISLKAAILAVFLICIFPYLVLSRFDAVGSRVSSPIAVFLLVMQLSIPYIAMRMSYKSISGEVDRNNHRLLLTFPISRRDLVIGKWLSRSIATGLVITLFTLISLLFANVLYNPMSIADTLWVLFVTILLGSVFCLAGVGISCTTDPNSVVSDILIDVIYIPTVFFWRLIPFLIALLVEGGGFISLPSSDYGALDYLILRLNPMESYASLVATGISSDINIFIPSTFRLVDINNGQIVNYSSTPVMFSDAPIYVQEVVTIPLSVILMCVILVYGYWKFNNREL